jgi:hypothetical protein
MNKNLLLALIPQGTSDMYRKYLTYFTLVRTQTSVSGMLNIRYYIIGHDRLARLQQIYWARTN